MQANEIGRRFDYHPATPVKAAEHGRMRAACRLLAEHMASNLPEGRERATALTKLEESLFWANAAIARSDPELQPDETP